MYRSSSESAKVTVDLQSMVKPLKSLSMLSALAAAVILGWVIYDGITRLVGQNGSRAAALPANEPSTSIRLAHATYDVERIVRAHLFGKKDVEPAQVTHLPETKLRLDLLGMVSSSKDHYARALIAVNSRNVKVYRVGDSIDGTDASLHAVEQTRVLLDRNGVLESLRIKREDIFSDVSEAPSASGTVSSTLTDTAYTVEPESETDEGGSEIRYSGVKESGGKTSKLPF